MLYPIKVIDIELSQPIPNVEGLEGYMGLQGLVRLHGVPLGYVKAPISLGKCTAATLGKLILEEHSEVIICQLLKNGLASPHRPADFKLEDLLNLPPVEYTGEWPLVTVAVCTRDRPDDIKLCLEAIVRLDYPNLDILVVDNAPATESTKDLIDHHYPQVRYVREPRPGLDWARNRAILEAQGEIIAFTDDDVIVDRCWVKGFAQVFADDSDVMAVTGLVAPVELETKSQILFEEQGGFGKGFEQKWYRVEPGETMPWWLVGTGNLGTGANMAYRRLLFGEIGYFDPALDVGTVTNGAGDLEMFYRVLKGGYTLIYEPNAVVYHRHRRTYEQLRRQIFNNGSVLSYFVCASLLYPEDRSSFIRVTLSWVASYHLPQLISAFFHPKQYPADLVLAEIIGCLAGLTRYHQSRIIARKILAEYKDLAVDIPIHKGSISPRSKASSEKAVKICRIELNQPIKALDKLEKYSGIQIFVSFKEVALDSFYLENNHRSVSKNKLCKAIVQHLGLKLIEPMASFRDAEKWSSKCTNEIAEHYQNAAKVDSSEILPKRLPHDISVSVIIGTFDRPQDLRECLQSISQQETLRQVEVIVVDNHPESRLTPEVLADFPKVKLVSESRQGVAYARNAGIAQSSGELVITIDDDVVMTPDWLERLITPFSRPDVVGVTGNVLPRELDTASQRMFEKYGGLGRGFEMFEASTKWFERSWRHAVPTWEFGGTANSAFRASIFYHPDIGLMHETLGPGMPSGVGEDIYLFYKILKAGYTMVYEPKAQVWHKHRRDLPALKRQIYNYSKGFVSYQLTTLFLDKDRRSLFNLIIYLPLYHLKRCYQSIQGLIEYPLFMILLEVAGNLAGPWSLWQSYRRVKRFGKSQPYIPVDDRLTLRQGELFATLEHTN